MKRVLPLLLILMFGTLFAVLLLNPVLPAKTHVASFPALSLIGQDGKAITLPPGKPAIVNIFASWCVPCAVEMPLLAKLAESVPVYGIAYRDRPEALAAYLKRYGNPFDAIALDDGTATVQLGITGVPESYLLDANGRIVRHMAGMLDEAQLADWQAEIRSWR